jgi:hypothetical protein
MQLSPTATSGRRVHGGKDRLISTARGLFLSGRKAPSVSHWRPHCVWIDTCTFRTPQQQVVQKAQVFFQAKRSLSQTGSRFMNSD